MAWYEYVIFFSDNLKCVCCGGWYNAHPSNPRKKDAPTTTPRHFYLSSVFYMNQKRSHPIPGRNGMTNQMPLFPFMSPGETGVTKQKVIE